MYCVYIHTVIIVYKIICIYVQIANSMQIAHVCKRAYIVRLQTLIFIMLVDARTLCMYSVCKLHIVNKYAIVL